MGGRSGSADLRCAAVAACLAMTAACTATSPPPLPARRVDFPAPAPAPDDAGTEVETVARPPDLPAAAEPPIRPERYWGWTMTADIASLIYWFTDPTDIYHVAPMLLLTPLIHTAHGEYRSAAISLGMRLVMYGTLYYADRLADRECEGTSRGYFCFPLGTFLLVDFVVSSVVVIDAVILARRDVPAQEWHRLPLLGAVADAEGRRMLTLSGRF
jgi:hypothetical protein